MKKSVVVAAAVGVTAVVSFGIMLWLRHRNRNGGTNGHKASSPKEEEVSNVVDMEFGKFRKTLKPHELEEFDRAYGELGELALRYLNEQSAHEIGLIIVNSVHLRNMLNTAQSKNRDEDVRKFTRYMIEGTSTVLESAIHELTAGLHPELQEKMKNLSSITMNYVIQGIAREQFLNKPVGMVH